MRLFIGTFLDSQFLSNIPFDEIREMFGSDVKNIKKENTHITWIFLGNVEESRLNNLIEIIDLHHKETFSNMTFSSRSLEYWPIRKIPRLIVLSGILNKNPGLLKLISPIKDCICEVDYREDFLPHITIARFKQDKTINKKIPLPEIKHFNWDISETALIKSTSSSKGPIYEKIKTWNQS